MSNNELKFTLIADGSSDKVLLNIIKWLLNDLFPQMPTRGQFADFQQIPNRPKTGDLKGMIRLAEHYYPFDILFVHRDAEATDLQMVAMREEEIQAKVMPNLLNVIVCVVPVKMMETWLLVDTNAIKKAAGNRNYPGNLQLPSIQRLEKEQNPKQLLHNLLIEASGKRSRKFNVHEAVHYVAEYTEDFGTLRSLQAFQHFEEQVKKVVNNWLSQQSSTR